MTWARRPLSKHLPAPPEKQAFVRAWLLPANRTHWPDRNKEQTRMPNTPDPDSDRNSAPVSGHDGPYPAPVEISRQPVRPEWIDYNGHMNVGYYGIAFDQASDVLLSQHLGVGVEHVEVSGQGPFVLQTHQHFLNEMKLGEVFCVRFRLIDHDAKRLHMFGDMVSLDSGQLCATQEIMVMNVDHATGRSAAYPDWAIRRFKQMKRDHCELEHPAQLGASLQIRRGR
jgi:acyl-CoA thioester hydrolase